MFMSFKDFDVKISYKSVGENTLSNKILFYQTVGKLLIIINIKIC